MKKLFVAGPLAQPEVLGQIFERQVEHETAHLSGLTAVHYEEGHDVALVRLAGINSSSGTERNPRPPAEIVNTVGEILLLDSPEIDRLGDYLGENYELETSLGALTSDRRPKRVGAFVLHYDKLGLTTTTERWDHDNFEPEALQGYIAEILSPRIRTMQSV